MNVVVTGPSWPYRSGIARCTTLLAKTLEEKQALSAFYVPYRLYPKSLYPGKTAMDALACPKLASAEPVYDGLNPYSWVRLGHRVLEKKADVLVAPFWTLAQAPWFKVVSRSSRTPTIGVVHNLQDHERPMAGKFFARHSLSDCAGFFCHSEQVARETKVLFPDKAVTVFPEPAIAATSRREREKSRKVLGIGENSTALLCFGLIRAYKGIPWLLETFSQVSENTPLTLLLVGEVWGEEKAKIGRLLAHSSLKRRVIPHLCWIPEDELPLYFSAADAAVFPYHSATGSGALARCVGWGLPVVATRVGSFGDLLEPEVSALLIPPGDTEALKRALIRICSAALREKLQAGVLRLGQQTSWEHYADALLELAKRIRPGLR